MESTTKEKIEKTIAQLNDLVEINNDRFRDMKQP